MMALVWSHIAKVDSARSHRPFPSEYRHPLKFDRRLRHGVSNFCLQRLYITCAGPTVSAE